MHGLGHILILRTWLVRRGHALGLFARNAGMSLAPIASLIVIGVALRLVLSVYSSTADLTQFAETSLSMSYGGGPYAFVNIYPPSWSLLLNLIGRGIMTWGSPSLFVAPLPYGPLAAGATQTPVLSMVVAPTFSVMEKSTLTIFDLGTGLLIYDIVKRYRFSSLEARTAFALWFLNPVVITVTAVHGDYDSVAAFFVLASVVLLMEREYVWSGLAIGTGAALKLYPLFLIPLGIAVIARRQSGPRSRALAIASYVLGAGGAGAVPFLPPGVLSSYLTFASTGATTQTNFGGFWVWSVGYLPGLGQILDWAYSHTATITPVMLGIAAGCAIAVSVLYFHADRSRETGLVSLQRLNPYFVGIVAATYFSVPVVQPQYIVWILPFLVLSQRWRNRKALVAFFALSALVPAFYYLGFGGPLYLWMGLPVFTRLVSPPVIVANLTYFASFTATLNPILLVGGFVALLASVAFAVVNPNNRKGGQGADL